MSIMGVQSRNVPCLVCRLLSGTPNIAALFVASVENLPSTVPWRDAVMIAMSVFAETYNTI